MANSNTPSMLDTTREKLRGMLGEFPQGFNTGATAGFPGYPGDMAYLLDAIRLALSGERSQKPPEEYPGTTEAIAQAAGMPLPKSLSGQLGMAVGGMLSPSPTDLLKFAPVLSAIPFFHGSPHKYDRVDLSKIGTGEGAQAYGHGYYGAESPQTAESYAAMAGNGGRITSTGAPPGKMRVYVTGADGKETSIGDFAPEDADAALTRARAQMGNMYRGEYRWPDPAKEVATPLTGEDLLDWDKPLGEQSEAVQQSLRNAYPEYFSRGWMDVNSGMPAPDAKAWGASDERLRQVGFDIGVPAERVTGEQFYREIAARGVGDQAFQKGGHKNASAGLLGSGVPGIRYLDQLSRGNGKGTYNIVMFDEKGIKLLERNGQPIRGMLDEPSDEEVWAALARQRKSEQSVQDRLLDEESIAVQGAESADLPAVAAINARITQGGRDVPIDKEVEQLVEALNRNGFTTLGSGGNNPQKTIRVIVDAKAGQKIAKSSLPAPWRFIGGTKSGMGGLVRSAESGPVTKDEAERIIAAITGQPIRSLLNP